MALNALTLSTDSGVQGRPFEAPISGLTTGQIEVLVDGTPGFSTVNGTVSHPSLPYLVNTVVLREREPGVGAGFRDTRIDIMGYSIDNPAPQSPPDGSAVVEDGGTVTVTTSAGANPHNATVSITGNTVDGVSLSSLSTMIDDGDDNYILSNSDDSSGGAMMISVINGVAAFKLFNAVQRVATHLAPIQITAGSKTVGATFNISAGVFGAFPLSNATDAIVSNADTAPVQNSAGAAIGTGTATVAAGAVSNIRLPATIAGVANAGTIAVRNSAGADSHNATAVVAAGVLTGVNLAATVAMVDNAAGMQVPVTGTYTNTITATVANGVVTGFVLS